MSEDLEKRMAKLERENRIWRAGGIVAFVLVAGLALMGQAAKKEIPDVIETHALRILDKDGRSRISMAVDTDSKPGLTLSDKKGDERAWFGLANTTRMKEAFKEWPTFWMGGKGSSFSISGDEAPSVSMRCDKGERRQVRHSTIGIDFAPQTQGTEIVPADTAHWLPRIRLFGDKQSDTLISVPSDSGTAFLVHDPDGKEILKTP